MAKQITKNDLKKQNKVLIVLASIFTFLIVAITTVIVFIPLLTGNKEITVPDVTGYSVEDAIKTLQDAGFTIASEQQQIASEEIEEGKVVRTSPYANSKAKGEYEVTLYISTGDPSITLEDYTGRNYVEVEAILKTLGVQVIIERRNVDTKDYQEGEILEQSPAAGEKVSEGDYITLTIPNFDVYPPGIVIAQNRASGSPIQNNTSITVTVAKAPTTSSSDDDEDDNTDSSTEDTTDNCGGLC
mgnify:CR=1 FL=1